jgi:peptidyl-tRNA hydrolase
MYFLGNMYISQIQHGIQAAHVIAEMFTKYKNTSSIESEILDDWARKYKTIIVLNGGYQSELESALIKIQNSSVLRKLPYAYFREEQTALNGALTCVGIVLPEIFYQVDSEKINEFQFNMHKMFGTEESEKITNFVKFIQSKRLA